MKKDRKSEHELWVKITKIWEPIALILYIAYMFGIPIIVFLLVYLLSTGFIKV